MFKQLIRNKLFSALLNKKWLISGGLLLLMGALLFAGSIPFVVAFWILETFETGILNAVLLSFFSLGGFFVLLGALFLLLGGRKQK